MPVRVVSVDIAQQSAEVASRTKARRPETFIEVDAKLSALERFNIRFIRHTFSTPWIHHLLLWTQRVIGAGWVHYCTRNIRHENGLERIRDVIDSQESVILVSNHRSFFDMYVINAVLCRAGFRQRCLYPVRSAFFYDHPLGFFVNGIMSWFSMYPPIFKDRKRATLNHVAFSELARDLCKGRSTGIHPEGTRKKDDDPYTFLPPQAGVGRLVHLTQVKVLPIFINGLGNDLRTQVLGNFNGKGRPVIVNFGAPIDFGELRDAPAGPRAYKALAERCMEVIGELGQEEKAIRAERETRSA